MTAYDPKRTSTADAELGTGRDAPHVNSAFMPLRAIGLPPTKAKNRIATATPAMDACICVQQLKTWREEIMFHFRLLQVTTALLMGVGTVAAAEMPKFDLTAACRGSGAVETRAKCLQDEEAARDQLAKLWPQFKQSDASRCVQIVTTGGAANYTELLSCLQAARIEEKPKDPFGPTPAIAK